MKYDKNSENKVRQEKINEERALARQEALAREQAKAPTRPVVVSVNKNDVRSGEIFSVDDKWKDFEINTRIKYRRLEDAMLYRLAIKAPVKTINEGKSPDCRFSSQKEKEFQIRATYICWARAITQKGEDNNESMDLIQTFQGDSLCCLFQF